MKSHTEYLTFRTKRHREYINITREVEAALKKSGIREGMILVSAMHITASVYVNDAEDGLIQDIDEWLETVAQRVLDVAVQLVAANQADFHPELAGFF